MAIQENVIELDSGARRRRQRAIHGRAVGFTCGSFDLMHAGHDLMLAEGRQLIAPAQTRVRPWLIVGLQKDPSIDRPEKNTPVQTLDERLVQLSNNRSVDEIIIYETEADLYEYLHTQARAHGGIIDARIVGADHDKTPRTFTGHDLPILVRFNSRNHSYSSSELRKRVYLAEKAKREPFQFELAAAE